MQSTTERRQALFETMCERRHETIDNLAFEFGVERRTIRRDIEILSCSYPIYTTKGTGGGVHIMDGYRYGIRYMTNDEAKFLESVAATLDGDDAERMQKIISKYKLPTRGGK